MLAFDLGHDVEAIVPLSKLQTAFSRQFAVSRVSPILFQKRFLDVVSNLHRSFLTSTSCTISHIATTKQTKIISKNRR